jgi:hypothetical protein
LPKAASPPTAEIDHQFRSHAPLDRFDPTRTNVSPAIREAISEMRRSKPSS